MKLSKQLMCLLLPVFLVSGIAGGAQIGIGTTTPNESAILDVSSSTRGLLPPRMTYEQMKAINDNDPAEGLIVYCSDCDLKGIYYYDGTNFIDYGMGHVSVKTPSVVTATGRIWMDRNLGATQVATSSGDAASYGYLFQWGRGPDGHQLRNSGTTEIRSETYLPGHADFIIAPSSSGSVGDWLDYPNNLLWQGVNGINNPCPLGFRLPTKFEWEEELDRWDTQNAAGAYSSALKLTMAGIRYHTTIGGVIVNESISGAYWSSTVKEDNSYALIIDDPTTIVDPITKIDYYLRADGHSVRCIKH